VLKKKNTHHCKINTFIAPVEINSKKYKLSVYVNVFVSIYLIYNIHRYIVHSKSLFILNYKIKPKSKLKKNKSILMSKY